MKCGPFKDHKLVIPDTCAEKPITGLNQISKITVYEQGQVFTNLGYLGELIEIAENDMEGHVLKIRLAHENPYLNGQVIEIETGKAADEIIIGIRKILNNE